MIEAILLFGFIVLGTKVLLGLAVVWIFIPQAPECSRCDGDTTRIEPLRGLRTLSAWLRVEYRWCPHCGESFLARRPRLPRLWVGEPEPRAPRTPPTGHALLRRPQ